MGINRFDVYGAGSATATDLRLDGARRQLGDRVIQENFAGRATISGTKWVTVAFDSPADLDGVGITEIVSTSALDTAIKFYVEGINQSGEKVGEYIDLNGTTAVTLANTYSWINVAQQYEGDAEHKGQIDFLTSSAVTQSVEVGHGAIQAGGYAVPVGYSAIINGLTIIATSATAGVVDVALSWMANGETMNQLFTMSLTTSLTPCVINIPNTFISSYRNGEVDRSSGGLFTLKAIPVSGGNATIMFTANCLITKI